jgi:glutathionyl-hydroquinone reductase
MGMLLDGKWTNDDEKFRFGKRGEFERTESVFRKQVTADGSSGFKAEAGRYHLLVAWSCPWAHRTAIFRKLKKLENVISIAYSEGPRDQGWAYKDLGIEGFEPIDGHFRLHQLYSATDPNVTARVTVPTLWDKKTRVVVNNESSEIIRMMNSEFNEFTNDATDYYPAALRGKIDEINDFVYAHINNGVYRAGFARTQEAYEAAARRVFVGLDRLESILAKSRYLCGDRITEADWRAFVTLVRFDPIYNGHFKCNLRQLRDYPNTFNYMLELYQHPDVGETIDIEKFKKGYYGSQTNVNPLGIVPIGPLVDYTKPHDRDRLPKAA